GHRPARAQQEQLEPEQRLTGVHVSGPGRGLRHSRAQLPCTCDRNAYRKGALHWNNPEANMRLIVVSGLAGAGKTVALKMLEDLGYYCIDNLPMELLHDASVATLNRHGLDFDRMAVGIDARTRHEELAAFGSRIDTLRKGGIETRVIYLHASDDVLLKRFAETRRKHPLTDDRTMLADAIALDRQLLA